MDSIFKIIQGLVKLRGDTDGTKIGNVGDALKVTSSNLMVPGIDWAHQMVHLGRAYLIDHVYELNLNDTHDHKLVTPSSGNRNAHFTWALNADDDTEIFLYESPTLTQGSEIVPINRNRNSSNVNTTKVYDCSNITNVGTRIEWNRIATATGAITQINSVSEIILKQNTSYLFRVKSNAASNIINSTIHWYEFDYTSGAG